MEISDLYRIFRKCGEVTTDSRHCVQGALFVALKGETFNGNAFAAETLQKGCSYALIDDAEYANPDIPNLILVDNCLQTLQQLARYHRRELRTSIIGITGTNGKTTTKELISKVLEKKFRTLYTQGNLNNHIGVPLTLLRLTEKTEIAVIEMGANHPGEIKALAEIAEPDYGVITNIGRAHLEGFGSFEGVVRTKGELYDFLRTRPNSVIFIDQDNETLKSMADGLNRITYGEKREAVKERTEKSLFVGGRLLNCDPYLQFSWEHAERHGIVQTQLIGAYNLKNALAAVTVGEYFKVKPGSITAALSEYCPQNCRSQMRKGAHNTLIIDAYNANPSSMMAAIENFLQLHSSPKMVILGDMKELGERSLNEHKIIADYLRHETEFDSVWLIGSQFAAVASGERVFADAGEAAHAIRTERPAGYTILIKGSNSMKLAPLADLL